MIRSEWSRFEAHTFSKKRQEIKTDLNIKLIHLERVTGSVWAHFVINLFLDETAELSSYRIF